MTTTPDNAQSRKPWWNRPIGGYGALILLLWLVTGVLGRPFMLRHYEHSYQQASIVEAGAELVPLAGIAEPVQKARRFAQAYRDLHNSSFLIAPAYCVTLYLAARQFST